MLSKASKVLPNFAKGTLTMSSTRDGFGKGIVELGTKDKNIVALCADLSESTRLDDFKKNFPDRFFELGVAEQNMAAIAAGLGLSGKIPFIASYATFSPGRNYEQIRTTIAYGKSNVKIIGSHAGVSVGPDGATHQATEDIAIMRVMPGVTVVVPADAEEARKATLALGSLKGPAYLRLTREKSPVFTSESSPFKIGHAEIIWEGESPSVALVACGPVVFEALLAAKDLEKEGISVIVVNCHTIKPLDEVTLLKVFKKCGALVTIEEHQRAGGLGGALAELTARFYPIPIESLGLPDRFGESGPPSDLLALFGLSSPHIISATHSVLKRKNSEKAYKISKIRLS